MTWKKPFVNDGGDKNFVFIQSELSKEWVINHSLNKLPSVDFELTNGNSFEGAVVKRSSSSSITVTFDKEVSGKAILN